MMIRSILLLSFSLFFSVSAYCNEKLLVEPDMGPTPILSAIQQAKSSIDVVMYGFTDEDFMHAFINARNNGKKVQILLEQTPYKNEYENNFAEQTLQANHVNLAWSNPRFSLTHQKTLIFDHKTAWIMTFNLTHASFSKERNFALVVDEPDMVNEIENHFYADLHDTTPTATNTNLLWSPHDSRKKLLDFIHSAHGTIAIYAQNVTDYKVIGALANAAKHGVQVDILTSDVPSEKNRRKYAYLMRAGVLLHFSKNYYIHAKVIMVDHQAALLGSMNLTKHSIDENRELSVITHNKEVIDELENTFQQDCGKRTTLNSKLRWWLQTMNTVIQRSA